MCFFHMRNSRQYKSHLMWVDFFRLGGHIPDISKSEYLEKNKYSSFKTLIRIRFLNFGHLDNIRCRATTLATDTTWTFQ